MLPSTRRISKTEFKEFGRGFGFHSPLMTLFVYKKIDQSPSQFSFLCSKKVSKSAVKRNLLRRRGYSIVGKVITEIQSGSYAVFSFKKGAEIASFSEINDTVLQLLKQAHLLNS